jgi:hypothetical protein
MSSEAEVRLNCRTRGTIRACRFAQGDRSVCGSQGRTKGWCGSGEGAERRRPVNKVRSPSASPRTTDRAYARYGGYSKCSRLSIGKPAPAGARRAIKSCMARLEWRTEDIPVPTSLSCLDRSRKPPPPLARVECESDCAPPSQRRMPWPAWCTSPDRCPDMRIGRYVRLSEGLPRCPFVPVTAQLAIDQR